MVGDQQAVNSPHVNGKGTSIANGFPPNSHVTNTEGRHMVSAADICVLSATFWDMLEYESLCGSAATGQESQTSNQRCESWIGRVANKKVTSKCHAPVLDTGLRGRYFVPVTTGGSKVCGR
jgi:hypothetical protein